MANAQREMENYRKCGDRCGEVGGGGETNGFHLSAASTEISSLDKFRFFAEATMKLAQAAVYLDKNRLQVQG